MKTTITVDVTQQDIDCGYPSSGLTCPVALALKRIRPSEAGWVCAGPLELHIGGQKWETPDEVFQFMDNFDKGKAVKPFSFTLEVEDARNE